MNLSHMSVYVDSTVISLSPLVLGVLDPESICVTIITDRRGSHFNVLGPCSQQKRSKQLSRSSGSTAVCWATRCYPIQHKSCIGLDDLVCMQMAWGYRCWLRTCPLKLKVRTIELLILSSVCLRFMYSYTWVFYTTIQNFNSWNAFEQ